MIVVDSNVWIFGQTDADVSKHEAAADKLKRFLPGGVVTNVVVMSEVFYKLHALIGRALAGQRVEVILRDDRISWEPFKKEDMERALVFTTESRRRFNDALIAAQAVRLKAPVLTDNVKDFRNVPGLEVIPLRERTA